jgi:hypothetical protein
VVCCPFNEETVRIHRRAIRQARLVETAVNE